MQLAKQEQTAKIQPFLKTSIFWTLEATLMENLIFCLVAENFELFSWVVILNLLQMLF